MELSVFDIFKIGIGPSSSHTVGPMRAANFLVVKLKKHGLFDNTSRIQCELFGSLASTGLGHHTDRAVVWGLLGEEPETIDPDRKDELFDQVTRSSKIELGGERTIDFDPGRDLVFKPDELLPFHPNGMRFTAFDAEGKILYLKEFYSIGGGFIVGRKTAQADQLIKHPATVEYPFSSGDELLELARSTGLSFAEIVYANEHAWRSSAEIGMEHNLGLTCDPIGGLVQVPCIERNAMAAVKAVNAARIALRTEEKGVVSLDQVIRTMQQTGQDMQSKYKETSKGGLAINITEC